MHIQSEPLKNTKYFEVKNNENNAAAHTSSFHCASAYSASFKTSSVVISISIPNTQTTSHNSHTFYLPSPIHPQKGYLSRASTEAEFVVLLLCRVKELATIWGGGGEKRRMKLPINGDDVTHSVLPDYYE
jgi:hypothetical protein